MTRARHSAVAATLALVAGLLVVAGGASAGPTDFTVRGSVNQLYVLGAAPGQQLELVRGTKVVEEGVVDSAGSLAWRGLDAGSYSVRSATPAATVGPVKVRDVAGKPPAHAFYAGQTLGKGFNYITTRDGTTLSANVTFPSGTGPFPTVVEYSGYDPSNPKNTTMAQLFTTLGFAYVGVNIRGTGCSGGSFRPFEPVQSVDGYDAIEAIAAQPWAKFHKVGMVGISYPGISQLYVAQTQPPSLAAITPLSVIDDTYRSTLYPGGILNTGFAVPWATEREKQAGPYGQGWEKGRVDAGDTTCQANQALRLQNPDVLAMIRANPYYKKSIGDPMNPSLFAPKINVPVFLAGAWQDEQTGGHFPGFLDDFTSAPHLYATMLNGSHPESLSLGVFGRFADFLDLYVGRRVPGEAKHVVAPVLAGTITGVTGLALPEQPDYSGMTFRQAKRDYESGDPIHILFEEGAAAGQPSGSPLPRFERTFASWPIPEAEATSWYLTPRGGLADAPSTLTPRQATPRSYRADPDALPPTTHFQTGDGLWEAHPTYQWKQIPKGKGLGWITEPLTEQVVPIGTGSVDLWVRSPQRDTDLEVTLTEVRPNGTEVYVQSGWLRASHRKLGPGSTVVSPTHTHLRSDARPLPKRGFAEVRVELFPFAHVFRPGSRIRITVDAPGNARPQWDFDTISHGERVLVAADADHPSRLVLPVVPGVDAPRKAPKCSSLRSQPCRTYRG
ncbi:CocE/NonD family hydrolase [Nocardioides sp. MAH-18]|uniref:CocE/NonD family hydrolase n=1 Tax=Nocardioides agri TaxID=2682843 RepID=A0A6L6XZ02_9ACTN|nr:MULTISPECIES: CocE/NonD family hydrolase [unclassified Nocardioides]MBA2952474.1 CocE/NonD family hydrolase [Nocardioides sp. CGMCC 1.13656]MVQ51636.1 CocE/NonD family hydrolase [Nocardioides sp. MAH-18]